MAFVADAVTNERILTDLGVPELARDADRSQAGAAATCLWPF